MRRLALILVTLITIPATSRAQTCLGGVSFEAAPVRLGGGAVFSDGAISYVAALQAGRHNAGFATIGWGRTSYDDVDETSDQGFLDLGYQVPVGSRAQICPIVGVAYGTGPDDAEFDRRARFGSAGLAIGIALGTPQVRVVPNAAVRYLYASLEDEATADGSKETFHDHSGLADLGVGLLLFNNRLAILPMVQIPFAGDDNEVNFGVSLSIGIGVRR